MTGLPQPSADGKNDERARLIDHFKVAYAIIIGIAITDSIKNAAPWFSWSKLHPAPFLFAVLFVTVVPIFQGGDRSLDLKYLKQRVTDAKRKEFIIQTTSLLVTAILFVLAAENIPHLLEFVKTSAKETTVENVPVSEPARFYFWMAVAVVWDVVILIREYIANADIRPSLVDSLQWVPLNLGLGLVCLGFGHPTNLLAKTIGVTVAVVIAIIAIYVLGDYIKSKPGEKATLCWIFAFLIGCTMIFCGLQIASADPASVWLALLVLGVAIVRTILDYSAGKEFMFPTSL